MEIGNKSLPRVHTVGSIVGNRWRKPVLTYIIAIIEFTKAIRVQRFRLADETAVDETFGSYTIFMRYPCY